MNCRLPLLLALMVVPPAIAVLYRLKLKPAGTVSAATTSSPWLPVSKVPPLGTVAPVVAAKA